MFKRVCYTCSQLVTMTAVVMTLAAVQLSAQRFQPTSSPITFSRELSQDRNSTVVPSRADILRGEYGRYRANNDLLFYHLDIRVDPQKKFVNGKNSIRFRMLKDDSRIQLDLYANLNVDKVLWKKSVPAGRQSANRDVPLKYERELGAVFVDFPETLKAGRVYTIDFYYSGTPQTIGRFGGFTFGQDPVGRPWIFTACEGEGASIWWPNKDQWRDEVESMKISVEIPNNLVDVSNGKLVGKKDLGDGYTRWDWLVHYPINNYNVSVNIGTYSHFTDRVGDMVLDFYALPENLEKAKKQFAQTKGMIKAFQHYFGEYPFKKDGYKLIETPYSGMEHQSAITYGNRFANGYLERDWTGVGISPRFDFIIIHESGHEWFGNSMSAADPSDMWIHEGWTTYLEGLYVEYMYGKADGLKYLNGYVPKVENREPIITKRGIHATPPQDQYFKGALFLNTLRSIVNDDKRWWMMLRNFYERFKYQNIMTEDVVAYFNRATGKNLKPIFDQYLRHAALPVLELRFDHDASVVSYRWKVDESDFTMPVQVGTKGRWQIIQPTTVWQKMKTPLGQDEFEVATNLYFVNVTKDAEQNKPRENLNILGSTPNANPSIEQKSQGTRPPAELVESFDGLGAGFKGPQGEANVRNPSDNTLAVGPNHIVQIVNTRMAVFTKKGKRYRTTGKVLYGPVVTNAVFAGFGGPCETHNNGDAVVRYDQLAGRWLITMPIFVRAPERPDQPKPGESGQPAEFSPPGRPGQPGAPFRLVPPAEPNPANPNRLKAKTSGNGPYSMCYAISVSSDPLGGYYRYEFLRPFFPDYPRPAIWPDGYYVPTSTSDDIIQKHACVLERSKMLRGLPAREQCFVIDGVNFLNNADIDGMALPPRGAPNIMMAAGGAQLQNILGDDSVFAWNFHVDWKTPSNTRLTGPHKIAVAPYQYLCGGQLTNCVPQPGTDTRLDAQGDKIMARLVYRKVNGHESLVAVHSVNTDAGGGGVRWYEFRLDKSRNPKLFQQGTFAPDGFYRWMASPAMDRMGNIGIGYSFGGTPYFAGQRFAARLANDPLGQLTLRETVLAEGEGVQKEMRWEDYTQTAIDPSDDCTIWYVGDYIKKGLTNYSSRIGAFRLPGCSRQNRKR